MLGAHCIRTWSATQTSVALSSAEAELVALVRASTEAIGLCQLAAEWRIQMRAQVFADASAALGIAARKGCGRLRHIRIGDLWIQEAARTGEVVYQKISGLRNPADLLTKHLRAERSQYLTEQIGLEYREGSAQARLQLSTLIFGSTFPAGKLDPRRGVNSMGLPRAWPQQVDRYEQIQSSLTASHFNHTMSAAL